jgi:hypothetical protein
MSRMCLASSNKANEIASRIKWCSESPVPAGSGADRPIASGLTAHGHLRAGRLLGGHS